MQKDLTAFIMPTYWKRIDKKWTKTIKLETATYLNLSSGDYTFKVASFEKRKRNKKPVRNIQFHHSSSVVFDMVGIYTIHPARTWVVEIDIVIRSRKLMQEKNKMLEEKVNQRTKELQQSTHKCGKVRKLKLKENHFVPR
ncbi:MAG: triple tyrosine motif-containing protein [Ferruginibacter sp.]